MSRRSSATGRRPVDAPGSAGALPSLSPAGALPGLSPAAARRIAYAMLAVLAFVWGTHWAVVKIGLRDLPPFTYVTLRVAIGAAAMAALLPRLGGLRLPPRGDLPVVLSVGLGQVAAGGVLMNVALLVVPAGRSSILFYTMPLWVVLIQGLALRVRLSRSEIGGAALGIAGLALLLNPAAIDWAVPGRALGSGLLLLAAVIWAITTIQLRQHAWRSTPFDLQLWQLLLAFVPLAALAVLFEVGREIRWSWQLAVVLLYSGPLATTFAFWATQSVSRVLSPVATTTGFLAVPVVGLVTGAVMLGEAIGPLDLLGFAVSAAGIGVVSLAPVLDRRRDRLGPADPPAADPPGADPPTADSPGARSLPPG